MVDNRGKIYIYIYMKVLVVQLCPTLFDSIDCSPPGSFVHRILQARILSELSFPSPGDLPDSRMEPGPPALQADSLLSETAGSCIHMYTYICIHMYVCMYMCIYVYMCMYICVCIYICCCVALSRLVVSSSLQPHGL